MTQPAVLNIGFMLQGGGGWLGGLMYIENLCRALLALPEPEKSRFRIVLFGEAAQLDRFAGLAAHGCRLVDIGRQPPIGFVRRQLFRWQRIVLGQKTPWFSRRMLDEGVDFVYPYCPQDRKPKPFHSAAWMPDLQHAVMPEMFSAAEVQDRDAAFRHFIGHAETIVLSSHSAREHCSEHYPDALPKLRVLEFPSVIDPVEDPDLWAAAREYGLPAKFFLLSNQFWRHKNHVLVLEALERLAMDGVHPCVACTGHTYDYRHPGFFDELLGEIQRRGLHMQVRILGLIPRSRQLQLMRTACAVIQPSLFEGWNTTVEDVRALGRPVLLSDIDVHLEQAPDGARYFEKHSADSLAEGMREAWLAEPVRETQEGLAALRQAQHVRVLDFARKFLAIANHGPAA